VDEGKRNEVAAAVIEALDDKSGLNGFALERLATALDRWATKENVPALVTKMGELSHLKVRHTVMETLGKLKDDNAVKPLVERLSIKEDLATASKALQAMGPEHGTAIEAEIAKVQAGSNKPLLIECCRILGAVGTKASVPVLTGVSTAASRQKQTDVAKEAEAALLAVKAR